MAKSNLLDPFSLVATAAPWTADCEAAEPPSICDTIGSIRPTIAPKSGGSSPPLLLLNICYGHWIIFATNSCDMVN